MPCHFSWLLIYQVRFSQNNERTLLSIEYKLTLYVVPWPPVHPLSVVTVRRIRRADDECEMDGTRCRLKCFTQTQRLSADQ
jgi:hypothetical protein